jgi:hypothetical protein
MLLYRKDVEYPLQPHKYFGRQRDIDSHRCRSVVTATLIVSPCLLANVYVAWNSTPSSETGTTAGVSFLFIIFRNLAPSQSLGGRYSNTVGFLL